MISILPAMQLKTSISTKTIIEKYFQQYFKRYSSSAVKLIKDNSENLNEKQKEIMKRGLPKQIPITGVKQILLVASSKGGVGKSTTSVNLAVALKVVEPNKSVGLLDADVFGPSIPLMMNLQESPLLNKHNFMEPLINYGVKCMSMGFLIDEKSPVVWRGLMVMSALNKLLRQVSWEPLDYLIIDTPPGTGDTQLSLIQNLPVSGTLLVTTPQKAAVDVTKRGAAFFSKVNVPIVGIVSNMSNIICPNCKNEIPLAKKDISNLANEFDINILCKIPFDNDIVESSDNGIPIVLSAPNSEIALAYKKLAQDVATFLKSQSVNTG